MTTIAWFSARNQTLLHVFTHFLQIQCSHQLVFKIFHTGKCLRKKLLFAHNLLLDLSQQATFDEIFVQITKWPIIFVQLVDVFVQVAKCMAKLQFMV